MLADCPNTPLETAFPKTAELKRQIAEGEIDSQSVTCFKCKEKGHLYIDCPKRQWGGDSEKGDKEERDSGVILRDLQTRAKKILSSPREDWGAQQKRNLRNFAQTVRKMMSRAGEGSVLTDSLEAQFEQLNHQLKVQKQAKERGKSLGPSQQAGSPAQAQEEAVIQRQPDPTAGKDGRVNNLSEEELFKAIRQVHENPINLTKPYPTPWMPRNYMSAFSFIPRYLEVNQNICAAVYLRHPVARPGLAEVPTPYPESVHSTAFNWYLRRR